MLIIGNGAVLTMGENNRFIEDGAVAIDGKYIKEVGTTTDLREKYPDAEFMDVGRRLIMPGLLNTHMHLYSTFSRGMSLPGEPAKNFTEILEKLWFKLDKCLSTEEELYYSAMIPIIEGIKCGVTGIIDHHASYGLVDGSLDILEKAASDVGQRAVLCYETSDRWGREMTDAAIRENVRFIKKKKNTDDAVKATFGLHASLTLSNDTLERCAAQAGSLGTGFHVHVAEGIEDVEDCLSKSGVRVADRLNSFGILGDKTLAVHCVHVDDNEIDILKNTGTMVIHNPQSNMNNGVGSAPLLKFFEKGILVGIGTDGYTPSMLESVKTAYILPKFVHSDPRVGFEESRRMLFENNARIFGKFYDRPVGVIKPGAYADIIIMDYYPPTPFNENNYFGHLIFGMRDNQVNTTIVGGRVLMKDHELVVMDEERIMARSREVANRFWEKIAND